MFYARGENPLALPAGDEPADAYGDEEDGYYSDLRKVIDGALVYQLEMNPPRRMGT